MNQSHSSHLLTVYEKLPQSEHYTSTICSLHPNIDFEAGYQRFGSGYNCRLYNMHETILYRCL